VLTCTVDFRGAPGGSIKLLTRAEARRIAAIAKLPELLRASDTP
jgi:hypothetical protein